MKKKVIAVFDIGKTNKKFLLFNHQFQVVYQEKEIFQEISDEDGFECDDADRIENWIYGTLDSSMKSSEYQLTALNFTTYGATLVYLSENGKRLTPFYNYLKPVESVLFEPLYLKYGGKTEFCRRTASHALGMLNSGLQIYWLKHTRKSIFDQVKSVLHLPQYLSNLFTGSFISELTSIGCHTAMWDFENNQYHSWLSEEGIYLPEIVSNRTTYETEFANGQIKIGVGIHDSSASLVPYLENSVDPFILMSTGTWCITMNPFNEEPLTTEQLKNDCLCYLGVHQKPVKSSRLFLGPLFEKNVQRIEQHFSKEPNSYRVVVTNDNLLKSILVRGDRMFFSQSIPDNYLDTSINLNSFENFEQAYHQLVFDIAKICESSVRLILPRNDESKILYISGGFSRNNLFVNVIANIFPNKRVFTSKIDNASALGAALMVASQNGLNRQIDLGLKEYFSLYIKHRCKPIN